MKRLIIQPSGWPCSLVACPPGYFVFGEGLCFKTEYRTEADPMEVYNEAGEIFWGGAKTRDERDSLIVQPVICRWEAYQE